MNYSNFNKKGLTLLEILVVMFIIAITIGVVSLSINSLQSRNELQPFADILYQRMTTIGQEAVLQQTEIGLSLFENKIEVLNYKISDNNPVWEKRKTLSIPNNVKLRLNITESEVFDRNLLNLDNTDKSDFYTNNNSPEIIFSSGGQISPFVLIISHKDEKITYVIKGEFSGEISIEMVPVENS